MQFFKSSVVIALTLLLGACHRHQLAEIKDKPVEREVDVRIDFRAPAAPKTNEGRPLESVDPLQKVTDVRLYFFRSEKKEGPYTYNLNLPVTDFANDESAQGDETHTYKIDPTLQEGYYYRILAIGLSEDSNEGITDPTSINWIEGVTEWGEGIARNAAEEMTGRMGETFTGVAKDIRTEEEIFFVSKATSIGFNAEVELHRAVAGVLLYVKDVPAEIEGRQLSRIAILTSGYNTTLNPFTRRITADFYNITNGVIAEIDVTNPQPTATFIAGNFLFPSRTFIEDEDSPSLSFAFYSEDSLEPFKTIPIKTVRAEELEGMENPEESEISADGLKFNLLANHIYCLGMKGKDIDEPFDLGKHLENPDTKIFIMGSYQADVDIPM